MNMKNALNQVWQAIANDLLPSEDDCPEFTGEHVAELVGDYAETYLNGEELKSWKTASWEKKNEWLAEAFPATELYGF